MPSTLRTTRAVLSLAILSTTLVHASPASDPALERRLPTMSYFGCFSSSDPLSDSGSYQYQSTGYCQQQCVGSNNQAVMGLTGGDDCWCGDELPASSDKVSDDMCNSPCTGYGQDDCGGDNYWSVYLTGTQSNVGNVGSSSSSSSSSTSESSTAASSTATTAAAAAAAQHGTSTTAAPSVVTSIAPGKTVVVTEAAGSAYTASSSSAVVSQVSKSSSPNVAGIAAGVVVGVVAVIAIIVGVLLFIRRRRRREENSAYDRKNAADFLAGGKVPARRRTQAQGPDARLDPEAMKQRRMSDGSIADNEDYSRRILKVANPDSS